MSGNKVVIGSKVEPSLKARVRRIVDRENKVRRELGEPAQTMSQWVEIAIASWADHCDRAAESGTKRWPAAST